MACAEHHVTPRNSRDDPSTVNFTSITPITSPQRLRQSLTRHGVSNRPRSLISSLPPSHILHDLPHPHNPLPPPPPQPLPKGHFSPHSSLQPPHPTISTPRRLRLGQRRRLFHRSAASQGRGSKSRFRGLYTRREGAGKMGV